jgi:hypothetical protein
LGITKRHTKVIQAGEADSLNFVGVDTGRKTTKVAGTTSTIITFPSVVGTGRRLNLENHQDYDAVIDGEHLFIGQLAEESLDRREMASERTPATESLDKQHICCAGVVCKKNIVPGCGVKPEYSSF